MTRYDPKPATWTMFDLPTAAPSRAMSRCSSATAPTQVVLPYFRTRKVAVMTLRSEADLAALKEPGGAVVRGADSPGH